MPDQRVRELRIPGQRTNPKEHWPQRGVQLIASLDPEIEAGTRSGQAPPPASNGYSPSLSLLSVMTLGRSDFVAEVLQQARCRFPDRDAFFLPSSDVGCTSQSSSIAFAKLLSVHVHLRWP